MSMTEILPPAQRRVGGPGQIVQIDETLVYKRKYNKGEMPSFQQWLFGAVDEQGNFAASLVPNRTSTLTLD
jgi:hypothetical protein